MKQSISSPSSSSYFHIGTSIPYFYQDFIARFNFLKGEQYNQIMATNSLGLRDFNSEEYFNTLNLMRLKWNGETISDKDANFTNELKKYINWLIEKSYIKKKKVEVFTCKNHSQIYLTPGENNYLKLVKKEKTKVHSFYAEGIGEVGMWGIHPDLSMAYIGVNQDYHGPNCVRTPYGTLAVKKIKYLEEPIVFYTEKNDSKKVKKIESTSYITQYAYKCMFCDETLIPVSQVEWIMQYPYDFNRDILKGVTPQKQWDTLASEIETQQIISRKRKKSGESGVRTLSINSLLGIDNRILDPEFCIQFLPIYVASQSKKPIDTFLISAVNQKYILNSLRLYRTFKRPIINNVLVVGALLGKNHQTMRKSNNNVVGLKELINKYGVDTVRLYLAHANLLIKESKTFEESFLKGYKRFINRILTKFENAELVEYIDIKEAYVVFSKKMDLEMKEWNFANAVNVLIEFFSSLKSNVPTNKENLDFLKDAIQYLSCFCPDTANKLNIIIKRKMEGI